MQDDEVSQAQSKADLGAAKSDLANKMHVAKGALDDVRNQVSRKAEEYASEAKEALVGQAQDKQRDFGANLNAFGGALRAASEHLANTDQKTAAKFILDAAGGLEQLSSSLKNKPFEEVLGEIRLFGRDYSGVLITGSVMAGLALGRFIKSSEPITSDPSGNPEAPGNTSQNRGAASADEFDRS